jgi:hypothetical protein
MKRINHIKKVAPRFMGVNTSGTLDLRCRARAAMITEALRAVLAARGPTATVDLWRLLGGPSCLSQAQIRRLLKKATNVQTEMLSYGGVIENMYGVKGDRRWKSVMQAFFADRRGPRSDKILASDKHKRKPMNNAENTRSPATARRRVIDSSIRDESITEPTF